MQKITKKQLASRIGTVRAIVTVLDGKLAENIKIIKVEQNTSLCNYFIICEGRATTHVKALADEVEAKLAEAEVKPLHIDGARSGNWIAMDYASVIVHIFDRESREFYNLEKLWRDGKQIAVSDL